MELVEVEAVEDRTRPDGGHAVIVLRGAGSAPQSARFKLAAIDADAAPHEARDILARTHEPLSVRETEDGIALEIGPGLADSAFLVPGMALEITLIDAGLRGEFLWPAVTPLARPKRRNIMTRRAAANDPLHPLAPTAPAAVTPPPEVTVSPEVTADPEVTAFPEVTGALEVTTPLKKDSEANPPTPPLKPASRASAEPTSRQPVAPAPLARGPIERKPSTWIEPARSVSAPPQAAENVRPIPLAVESAVAPVPVPLDNAVASSIPVTPGAVDAQAVPSRAPADAIGHDLVSRWTPATVAAFAVASVLALQLAGLKLLDLRLAKRSEGAFVAQPLAQPAAQSVAQPAAEPQRLGQASIYEVFAAGPVSPRGLPAEGVSAARALQLAHTYQYGPEASRHRDEAIYWLKRYLILTAGTENTRIALTQLGTAYARPIKDGQTSPDIGSAITAWEFAAAMGDTVAMCFLATLHERGLGVPANPVEAATWTKRAAGGAACAKPGPQ